MNNIGDLDMVLNFGGISANNLYQLLLLQQLAGGNNSNCFSNLFSQPSIFKGPFDSTTNEGWGANAFVKFANNPNRNFSITKETTTGNTIDGSDGKKLSIESALAFSELSLQTVDGRKGNSDGKVSVDEFNKNSGGQLGNTIDTDSDGFISRAELTSIYLLGDKLDGKQDGKVIAGGSKTIELLSQLAPNTIKNTLLEYNDQIKDADSSFQMQFPAINGENGPYDNSSQLGKYANIGYEDAKLNGKNLFSDFEYASLDQTRTILPDGTTAKPTINIETGLASHTAFLKERDLNKDGKISVNENRLSKEKTPDLDGDGFISAGEYLAETIVWDKNKDGKISYSERLASVKLSNSDDYEEKVKKAYDDNKIADAEKTFVMPEKTVQEKTDYEKLIELLKQLLGLE